MHGTPPVPERAPWRAREALPRTCTVRMHAGSTTPARAPLCRRDGELSGRADTSPKSTHGKTGAGESPPGQAHQVGALGTRKAFSTGTPVRRAWAEGPPGQVHREGAEATGPPGSARHSPGAMRRSAGNERGGPQSGSGHTKGGEKTMTKPALAAPRACTPEPALPERCEANIRATATATATAAIPAVRGAVATFTTAPICHTIAARLNPDQHRPGHSRATRGDDPPRRRRRVEVGLNTGPATAAEPGASSRPVVAAGLNPAYVRARPRPRISEYPPPRRRCRIEPGLCSRPATATRPEVYSCLVVTDCLKSARRPVGSGRWGLDRERRR
jgi:hypothetical protein